MPNVDPVQVRVAVNPDINNNNEIPVRQRNRLIRQAENAIVGGVINDFIGGQPLPNEMPEPAIGIRPVQINPYAGWIQNPVAEVAMIAGGVIEEIPNDNNKKEMNNNNNKKYLTLLEWAQSPSLDPKTANIKKWFREFSAPYEMRSIWWHRHIVTGLVDSDTERYTIIPNKKDSRTILICLRNEPVEHKSLNTFHFRSLRLDSLDFETKHKDYIDIKGVKYNNQAYLFDEDII